MSRCITVLVASVLVLSGSVNAQPDKGDAKPSLVLKVDSTGLPEHARVRLGKLGGFRYVGAFSNASITPDGKTLAIIGQNGDSINIVDVASGKSTQMLQTRIFGGIGGGVSFSPDGSTIAMQTFQDLKVWDVASGKQLQAIQHRDNAGRGYGPSLSKDGKIVGIGSERFAAKDQTGEIKAFETATGKAIGPFATLHNYNIRVAMAPDGKTMASWGNFLNRGAGGGNNDAPKTIQVWDIAAGKELRQIKLDFGPQGYGQVANVTFAPDAKTMAVVSGTATFHLLDTDTGKETRRFAGVRGSGNNSTVRFSPDGDTLAAFDNYTGNLQAWEVKSGKRIEIVDGPKANILGVAFPAKGKILALANVAGALFWWDATAGEDASPFAGHLTSISTLAYLPDGKTLLSAGADQQLIYWDADTGKERQRLRLFDDDGARYGYAGSGGPMRTSFAISPNAKYAATMSDYTGGLRLWNLKTGRAVCDFEAQRGGFGGGGIAFSPDSTRLASTGGQSPLLVWDINTGQELPKLPGNLQARNINLAAARVAFSPDGNVIASHMSLYDPNGRPMTDLVLWDIANKKELHRANIALPNIGITNSTGGMQFSHDGRYLALSDATGSVALLYANTGKEAMRLATKNKNANYHLAFSADGRFLAVGSMPFTGVNIGIGGRNDQIEEPLIEIWELASGSVRDQYKGHTAGITCLAFSPDGATLASGSMDTTILLWDFAGKHAAKQPYAADEMQPAWKSLDGKDPKLAVTIRRLIQTPETVAFLKKNLEPVKDQSIDAKTLDKLVADLGSGTFKTRDSATRELKRLGERAEAALKKAMAGEGASVEARRRMQELLDGMVRKAVSPEELQALRGIEILERIASAEAREHLAALSKGDPVSAATVEAGRALKRMTAK